jgi:CheY-like chemotaxis protein
MQTSVNSTDQILVIDDDEVMREVLSLLLDAEGHRVLTADSGEAAMALLAMLPPKRLPDVVLTDLKMPGMSQPALATRLRLACPPPAVLIAMSGSTPTAGEAAAFDAFLMKPFTVADLDAAVGRARAGAAEGPDPKPGGVRHRKKAAVPAQDEVLNETTYAKLSAAMGASLPQFHAMILDDTLARIERMRAAVASRDEENFVREAHTIKGSCGMLGATELQVLAERVETGGLADSSLLHDFGPAVERLRRILDKQAGQTG